MSWRRIVEQLETAVPGPLVLCNARLPAAAVEAIALETTNSLIERVRQQNKPLADALAELVKNYRFDILQELFEEIE